MGRGSEGEQLLRTADFEFAYRPPELHHPLGPNGRPLEGEPRKGGARRVLLFPFRPRGKGFRCAGLLGLETYTENALINEIRGYVDRWQGLRNPADWGVTAVSSGPWSTAPSPVR